MSNLIPKVIKAYSDEITTEAPEGQNLKRIKSTSYYLYKDIEHNHKNNQQALSKGHESS